MKFPFTGLISLTLAAAAAQPALSAQGDPPLQLARLHVTASRAESLTAAALDTARAELALTPGGVETVDARRFLRGRASTLEDTFALSAGVIAQSRFGADEARLSIRGSGLQRTFHGRGLRVLQDGVPLNLADGSFDMQAIEPLATAYVNVWRGANAVALGASTLGGAIDYVSRTGRTAAGAWSRVELGSWGYLRASLAGGAAGRGADGFVSFSHHEQDGFRDHARQSSQRVFANTGHVLAPQVETRFYVTGVRTRSELPGSLTWTQLRTDPAQAAATQLALHQKRDFELLRVANRTTWQQGPTRWDFTAAWSYKDLDHPIFQVIDQRSNDLTLGTSASHKGELAGRGYQLRAGALFTRGSIDAANFVNAGGRRGPLVAAATQTATNLEAFVENQIVLGRGVTLVLAASGAVNRRANDQNVGAAPDYALTYRRAMPKLGLRWDAADAQVYANVAGSYEPPSFSEALTQNTARRAQTARTWELGTRGVRGPVRWDLSWYHATLQGELLSLDDDNNPATPAATVNADATVHHGIEAALEIDLLGATWQRGHAPAHRLVLRGAWTHGRFRFDEDPRYGRNTLAGLPPHLIRAELMWEHRAGWFAGPLVEVVPVKTFIDFRNTYAAPSHTLAALRVGRRVARGVSWFVELRNVLDTAYAATTGVIENAAGRDQPQFLPGDRRAVYGGVDWAW